jgi:hypothetical protein
MYLGGTDTVDYRCRFHGECKTMTTLPYEYGIMIGFFLRHKITGLYLEILNWKKWATMDFLKIQLSAATKQRLYR